MADCTHTTHGWSVHLLHRSAAWIAVALLASAWLCATARADGDRASDILTTESLFLSQDAGVPSSQQVQLASLLVEAARSGYPIRVALVASRADLGSVDALWQRPAGYAQFLGQELSLVYRGRVLVVMPGGFGLYRATGTPAPERAALARLHAPGRAAALGASALEAVRQLAAATGRPLPLPSTLVPSASGSSDAVGWAVFAVGGVMIAVAWGASLRVRPLRPRRHPSN